VRHLHLAWPGHWLRIGGLAGISVLCFGLSFPECQTDLSGEGTHLAKEKNRKEKYWYEKPQEFSAQCCELNDGKFE
jgi:hypothetical protein